MIHHNTLDAAAFYQTSAENYALYIQTFALARWRLLFEYERRVVAGDNPADFYIISDLDETLLNNSAYNASLIQTGRDFHLQTWSQWCQSKQAVGTPGAKAFLEFVQSVGVKIYYVSSRSNDDRDATAQTLTNPDPAANLGYPLPDASASPETTHLFLAGMTLDQPSTPTTKGEQFEFIRVRRQHGATPLLQLGDNLSDHEASRYDRKVRYDQRFASAGDDLARWGADWIVFPNSIYGAWRQSLRYAVNGVDELAADEVPPKPYQPGPVREPVTPAEAPKLGLLERWPGP